MIPQEWEIKEIASNDLTGNDLTRMCDMISEIQKATTNGDALGVLTSFRYNTRLEALNRLLKLQSEKRETDEGF